MRFGPLWIIFTGNQWEISEVCRLSCFIDFFVWFHIVCDRYTSDYAHFTFSDTIWPLSLSSDFGTRSCTHTDTASYIGSWKHFVFVCVWVSLSTEANWITKFLEVQIVKISKQWVHLARAGEANENLSRRNYRKGFGGIFWMPGASRQMEWGKSKYAKHSSSSGRIQRIHLIKVKSVISYCLNHFYLPLQSVFWKKQVHKIGWVFDKELY